MLQLRENLTVHAEPPGYRKGLRLTSRLAAIIGPRLSGWIKTLASDVGPEAADVLRAAWRDIVAGDVDPLDTDDHERVADTYLSDLVGILATWVEGNRESTVADLTDEVLKAMAHPDFADLVADLTALAYAETGSGRIRLNDRGMEGLGLSIADGARVAFYVASNLGFFSRADTFESSEIDS